LNELARECMRKLAVRRDLSTNPPKIQ